MFRRLRAAAPWAGLQLLAVAFAGCSSGYEEDEVRGPLDSPEAVVQRLATGPLSAFFAPKGSTRKSRMPGEPFDAYPGSKAKALLACPDGGTREEFETDTGDLGSPFTSETFLIEDTLYDACEETFDDGTVLRQTGLESYGCPLSDSSEYPCSDGSDVEIYTRWLGSRAVPFEDAVSRVTAAGNEVQSLVRRPGYRFHQESVYDFAGVAGRTRTETHTYSPSSGSVSVNGAPARGFTASHGLSGDPLVRVRVRHPDTGVRLTVDGPSALSGTGCELGAFRVHTLQPIQYSEDEFGDVLEVFAGRVEIQQDGQVAVAEIAVDGNLRITDARGRITSYRSADEARDELEGCTDFAAQ